MIGLAVNAIGTVMVKTIFNLKGDLMVCSKCTFRKFSVKINLPAEAITYMISTLA